MAGEQDSIPVETLPVEPDHEAEAPVPAEVPEGEAPAPEAAAAPEGAEQPAGDTPEPRGTRRWQKRVDKLTHRVREAEALVAQMSERMAQQNPTPDPAKPTSDKFATYEEYLEALTDYKLEKRSQPEPQAPQGPRVELADDAEESIDSARERIKDFDAVVFNPNIVIRPMWVEALGDSPVMGDVMYHLAKNQKEAQALAKMSPAAQVRELGRIEARMEAALKAPAKPIAQPSSAPVPITPVRATAPKSSDLSDPNLSDDDFERILRQNRRKR